MRFILAFMAFTLLGSPAAGQVPNTDVNWFESLFKKASIDTTHNETLRLLNSAYLVAREEHDLRAEARVMIEIAAHHQTQLKDYETSLDWLIKALVLSDSSNLSQEKIYTLIAIARIFEDVGEFQKSIEQLNRAITVKQESDLELLILILNERGRAQFKLRDFEGAKEDYEQMLTYARNGDLLHHEANALYAMGVLLTETGEYEEALKNHKAALAIRRDLKDTVKEAESLNSVGQLYLRQKNFERSKANHEIAIKIRKNLKNPGNLAESYNNMGELFIAQQDYKTAINNFELALSNSQKSEDTDQRLKAFEGLSTCYKELGDYKNALQYHEQFAEISEFIQLERDKNKLSEVQNQFTIKGNESKINQLTASMAERDRAIEEHEKEKKRLFLILSLAAIIACLLLFLYFIIRKNNRKLKELNETKDKLFSIIGHDLKGPLNSLTAFSSLLIHHAESLTKEEIKMLSGDVDKSLKNLFQLLENLLEWARSQTGNIDFKATVFDLSVVLQENCELLKGLAQKKNIALINMSGTQLMVNAHRHSINTVVRNLISNAIKFTSQGGQIVITTEPAGNQIKVTIADNGVGMSKEIQKSIFKLGTKHSTLGTSQEKGTGLGLILCKDFVEKNGGSIGVESEEGKGSRFNFTIPGSN